MVAVLLAPLAPAHAHGAVAGTNSFYAGLFHPFQNLPQMLVLIGLGLWLGQRPAQRLKWPMLAFSVCCAVALLLTTGIVGVIPVPAGGWLIGLALCFGVLIASAVRTPAWLSAVMAAVAAIAVALDSGVDGSPDAGPLALILLGTWICTCLLVANVAYYTGLLPQRRWVQIGIRIAGSWMAAAAVLVLAFYLKGQAAV